jgi:hypothetical protein
MDDDLEGLEREGLINEVKRLRAGIRAHRDSSGHDLCWHHPQLWGAPAGANRAGGSGAAVARSFCVDAWPTENRLIVSCQPRH